MPAIILALILVTSAILTRTSTVTPRQHQSSPVASPIAAPAVQTIYSSTKLPNPSAKTTETSSDPKRADVQPVTQNKNLSPPPDSSKGFIARMKVTQSGTLTVTIDGSMSQGYDLIVGDSIEWKANRSITFELSNAGGVEVDLNGKQLKSFGPSGKPAVVVLDADGVKP
jgi:hypothetical protein